MKRICTLISQIYADRRPGGQNLIGKRMRLDSSPNAICVHPREIATHLRFILASATSDRPTVIEAPRKPFSCQQLERYRLRLLLPTLPLAYRPVRHMAGAPATGERPTHP